MHSELVELINAAVSGANAQVSAPAEDGAGDSSILVDSSKIKEVCLFLRDNDKYPFAVLQVVSGIDYTEYLEVCYMLACYDLQKPYEVILKTRLTDRQNPQLESVVDVWPAANFQERECYDMLGVRFLNHPDHRRILCPDDWEGYPLRKDYQVQEVYNGMVVNPENKMNWDDRKFEENHSGREDELMRQALAKGL